MQKCDNICAVLIASSFDQSIRSWELRACASGSMFPRGMTECRALRVRSGFCTSCLQSEMILPHMPAQPELAKLDILGPGTAAARCHHDVVLLEIGRQRKARPDAGMCLARHHHEAVGAHALAVDAFGQRQGDVEHCIDELQTEIARG